MVNRYAGLDYLRFVAIILVTIQHGASVLGLYEQTQVMGMSPGQLGVAIFCAISGYLAFSRSSASSTTWLMARFKTIYPAYWLAMLFSFGVTWAAGAKDFTAWQFISQMLGTGYFTHGWNLVNVVSWFISLIVLCYVLAAVARSSGRPFAVMLAVFTVAAYLIATKTEVNLSRHILAFSLAAVLRLSFSESSSPPRVWWLLLPAVLWLGFGLQFGYAAVSIFLLLVALKAYRSQAWLEKSTPYIYEYFLLHGVFLVGIAKFFPNLPVIGVIIAIGVSVIAAWLLHHVVALLWRLASRPQTPAIKT